MPASRWGTEAGYVHVHTFSSFSFAHQRPHIRPIIIDFHFPQQSLSRCVRSHGFQCCFGPVRGNAPTETPPGRYGESKTCQDVISLVSREYLFGGCRNYCTVSPVAAGSLSSPHASAKGASGLSPPVERILSVAFWTATMFVSPSIEDPVERRSRNQCYPVLISAEE